MTVGEVAMRDQVRADGARPALTPAILGTFLGLAAAVRLVTAISLWRRGSFLDHIWEYRPREHVELIRLGGAAPALFFAFSILIAVTAVDCFGRRRWGWGFAVFIFAVDALASAARGFLDSRLDAAFGVVFSAAVLFWLTRPRVQVLFDR